MPNWPSPLEPGQMVGTSDGFIVEVMDPPVPTEDHYLVKILVLAAPTRYRNLLKQQIVWAHQAPNQFLGSKITLIDGAEVDPQYSLEEEFFAREHQYETDSQLQVPCPG